ncbi:GNAT family N-acetyltransferase [Nocardioides sp. Arc9.136]|uniref:GNAT family N-acetyltransferase n=1 Tax=Nocardioides sp. Arc9.136 TaxID=2996826 RepID=UPI002666E177|nr:GNAT family N-acetyltransferase [Nocardioides sp. Arc9.136]WKN47743.1 GNAT family N-acetyltransferase [Nocardioides sp. Arc9.136]
MSVTPVLVDRGEGRAELVLPPGPLPTPDDVRGLLVAAFGAPDLRCVVAYVAVDAWPVRRLLHELGFAGDGVLRGWLPDGADAWTGTLLRGEPPAPRRPWPVVPELAAEGLLLRPWRATDVPRIVEGCADRDTQAWLGQMPSPYTEESARAWLHQVEERLAAGTAVNWAVVDPADPADPDGSPVLGSVGWFGLVEGVDCEIGYWVHPDARGRRVATRALRAVAAHAFATLDVRRVRACAAAGNAASRRVIEACGFTQYGVDPLGAWTRAGREPLALYDLAAPWAGAAAD